MSAASKHYGNEKHAVCLIVLIKTSYGGCKWQKKSDVLRPSNWKLGILELDSCSMRLTLHFPVSLLSAANVRRHFFLPLTLEVFCYLIKNRQPKQELSKKYATAWVSGVMLLAVAKWIYCLVFENYSANPSDASDSEYWHTSEIQQQSLTINLPRPCFLQRPSFYSCDSYLFKPLWAPTVTHKHLEPQIKIVTACKL